MDDPAAAVGELLAKQARAGGSIVLTGGSTPGDAYRHAARLEPDWSTVTLWWGDERCVPPDDERSNYRLAKETLLDLLETPPGAIHRIRGEAPPPQAAAELDDALAGVTLDLLLLGPVELEDFGGARLGLRGAHRLSNLSPAARSRKTSTRGASRARLAGMSGVISAPNARATASALAAPLTRNTTRFAA